MNIDKYESDYFSTLEVASNNAQHILLRINDMPLHEWQMSLDRLFDKWGSERTQNALQEFNQNDRMYILWRLSLRDNSHVIKFKSWKSEYAAKLLREVLNNVVNGLPCGIDTYTENYCNKVGKYSSWIFFKYLMQNFKY